jgi:hypothetical protein
MGCVTFPDTDLGVSNLAKFLTTITVTSVAVFGLTWFLFSLIYRPTDQDYLVTTTSYYFKAMSEIGKNSIAAFSDCHLDPADSVDRQQDVQMFGLCAAEDETNTYHYSIAMSPTTNLIYYDLEKHKKTE